MVTKKILSIHEREKAKLIADEEEKLSRVSEIHSIEGFSPAWQLAKNAAGDARAYKFAYARVSTSRRYGKPDPSSSKFWIDMSHQECDLSHSAIKEKLRDVPADGLREIIADFLVYQRGTIDSAIDNIEAKADKDGNIKINDKGDEVPVSELQMYFRYVPDKKREYHPSNNRRSISASFNKILFFSEGRAVSGLIKNQAKGGHHPAKPDTKKKSLERWLVKQWEGGQWSTKVEFINKLKDIAPPGKAETLDGMSESAIMKLIPIKKKYSRKK